MESVRAANRESRLPFLRSHNDSGVSSEVESLERASNVRRGDLLRWLVRTKTSPSPPSSRIALISFVCLAVVHLLLRCSRVGHNDQGPSRSLVEGGGSPSPDCLWGASSEEEENLGGDMTLPSIADVWVASYENVFQTEEQAIEAGWGLGQVPVIPEHFLKVLLGRMLQNAAKCKKVMLRLPSASAAKLLREVARVAAIELACLSIVPAELEDLRQRVITAYIGLLEDCLTVQPGHHLKRNISETFSKLIAFFRIIRTPYHLDANTQVRIYLKMILSSMKLAGVTDTVVKQCLDRLLRPPGDSSGQPSSEALEQELGVLDALRAVRVQRTLISKLRKYLKHCQRNVGGWFMFSEAELAQAMKHKPLLTVQMEAHRVHEAVESARNSGRERSQRHDTHAKPGSRRALTLMDMLTPSQQSHLNDAADQGARHVPAATTSHRQPTRHTPSANEKNAAHQETTSVRTLLPENRDLVLECFEFLEDLASATQQLQQLLSPVANLEFVIHVTALATLDLGGFAMVPGDLEPRRHQIAQRFIELASGTLARIAHLNSPQTLAALHDRLEVLARIQIPLTSSYNISAERVNEAMRLHGVGSLGSVQLATSSLDYFRTTRTPASSTFTLPEMEPLLSILEALVKLRVKQVLGIGVASYWLTVAQGFMKAPVFFSRETLRDAQAVVSVEMIQMEIEELAEESWKHLASWSQGQVSSHVWEGAGAASAEDSTHSSGYYEGWQAPMIEEYAHGSSYSSEDWRSYGMWEGADASAAEASTVAHPAELSAQYKHWKGETVAVPHYVSQARGYQGFPGIPVTTIQSRVTYEHWRPDTVSALQDDPQGSDSGWVSSGALEGARADSGESATRLQAVYGLGEGEAATTLGNDDQPVPEEEDLDDDALDPELERLIRVGLNLDATQGEDE